MAALVVYAREFTSMLFEFFDHGGTQGDGAFPVDGMSDALRSPFVAHRFCDTDTLLYTYHTALSECCVAVRTADGGVVDMGTLHWLVAEGRRAVVVYKIPGNITAHFTADGELVRIIEGSTGNRIVVDEGRVVRTYIYSRGISVYPRHGWRRVRAPAGSGFW